MRHPFELELSELETVNLEIQEITDEEAEKVSGGHSGTTRSNSEARDATTPLGEEGGDTTPLGEEGGVTTLALGEEGWSW